MLKQFVFTLIVSIFIGTCGTVYAGLDQHGRFGGEVIAVYKFENTNDSGPLRYDGSLRGESSIVNNGKIGKCLRLGSDGKFVSVDLDKSLSVVSRSFSVVAWVKTTSTTGGIWIDASGIQEGDSNYGSISINIFPGRSRFGNFVGGISDDEDNDSYYTSENMDVSINDGKWHHFAFSLAEDFYRIFIDGDIVYEDRENEYIGFLGFEGSIVGVYAVQGTDDRNLNKPAFVDEVGFFETGFSVYEIQGLYDDGLADFLEAMPVDPQAKVATTWGELKSQQ